MDSDKEAIQSFRICVLLNSLKETKSIKIYQQILFQLLQSFKQDEKLLRKISSCIFNQQGFDQNQKVLLASIICCFLKKNFINQTYTQPNRRQSLNISSWLRWITDLIESGDNSLSIPAYKYSLIDMYVRLSLQSMNYSKEGERKLINSIQFYMKKNKKYLALGIIEKLLEASQGKGRRKIFKDIQAYNILYLAIIENLSSLLQQSDSFNIFFDQHQMMSILLSSLIQLVFTQDFNCLSQEGYKFLLEMLEKMFLFLKEELCFYLRSICENYSYSSTGRNKLNILNKVFILYQRLMEWENIFHHQQIIKGAIPIAKIVFDNFFYGISLINQFQIKGQTKQAPTIYISIVNFLLSFINLGFIQSKKVDGSFLLSFVDENQQFALKNCINPLVLLFFQNIQHYLTITSSQFLSSVLELKQVIFSNYMEREERKSCFLEDQEPIIYSLIRLTSSLSAKFYQFEFQLRKVIAYFLEPYRFKKRDKLDEGERFGIEKGIIGLYCFYGNLSKDKQFLLQIKSIFNYAISQIKEQIPESRRLLYLLFIDLILQDILYEPNSDYGLIHFLVNELSLSIQANNKNQILKAASISILQQYFRVYRFPFKFEKQSIPVLLNQGSPQYLQLQVLLINIYYSFLDFPLISAFLSNLQMMQVGDNEKVSILKKVLSVIQAQERVFSPNEQPQLQYFIRCLDKTLENFLQHIFQSEIQTNLSDFSDCFRSMLNIKQKWFYGLSQIKGSRLNNKLQKVISFLVERMQIQVERGLTQINEGYLNFIFFFMDILPQCQRSSIKALCSKIILIFENKSFEIFESMIKGILILHYLIVQLPQAIEEGQTKRLMKMIEREANRKNMVLKLDTGYLYRGKIYSIFLLLLVNHWQYVFNYLNCLKLEQVNQNKLPGRNESIYLNIIEQVFLREENYMPDYEALLAIYSISSIFNQLLVQSHFQKSNHSSHKDYIHYYLILLIKCGPLVEQQTNQTDLDVPEELEIDQFTLNWRLAKKLSGEGMKKMFNAFFTRPDYITAWGATLRLIETEKRRWLTDIQNKYISQQTLERVQGLKEKIGSQLKIKRGKYLKVVDFWDIQS